MEKYKVLVLTDATHHSKENSLYALLRTMLKHPLTAKIDVASRQLEENISFFQGENKETLWISEVQEDFAYTDDGFYLKRELKQVCLQEYDWVWLRMPPPLLPTFLHYIENVFQGQCIINDPKGIYETGSKEYLLHFSSVCPPMQVCRSKEDIIQFKNQYPIVLKPFREYGGKGIVKIDGNEVWLGKEKTTFQAFIDMIDDKVEYLGVKFLKNVSQGDKRIIVVNGEIMGASLRLPAENSWICNVAMGGKSILSEVREEEQQIVNAINPYLARLGIVMYGIDTLLGDDNKRVLSEINTTSIGGLPQMAAQLNLPLVEKAVDLIWAYFLQRKQNKNWK